ncbi:MAG: ferritin family protein [Deltaproteobacteria bacterium]|nr:ferritin family protein [Deltaproteobacteria bacterium]
MNFESVDEVISFAIEKEKEAVAFYEDASSQQIYSGARQPFQEFAREERKHQALLEEFAENTQKLAEYEFKWIPDLKRSDYLVDAAYKPGMPYPDMLRLAMKREEKALALYNEFGEDPGDEEMTRLFRMLAQEEAKHKLALETIYDDFMASQGD